WSPAVFFRIHFHSTFEVEGARSYSVLRTPYIQIHSPATKPFLVVYRCLRRRGVSYMNTSSRGWSHTTHHDQHFGKMNMTAKLVERNFHNVPGVCSMT